MERLSNGQEDKFAHHPGVKGFLIDNRWLFFWILIAAIFFCGIWVFMGKTSAIDFAAGYIVELSLSVDNLFVFLFIFKSFHIEEKAQHRVLNYGIAVNIILRFTFIFIGLSLLNKFEWIFYIFGGLLVLSGVKMLFEKEDDKDPHDKAIFRIMQKVLPMTKFFVDDKFMVKNTMKNRGKSPNWPARHSKVLFTPLLAVLLLIEFSDVIFAIDSVPAILSMTRNSFVVYTSNFFAVMGMRRLFFIIEYMENRFAYVKYAVSVILMFTGAKMLVEIFGIHVENLVSIAVICSLLAIGIIVSVVVSKKREGAEAAEVVEAPEEEAAAETPEEEAAK